MSRIVLLTGALLVVLGLGVFAWKVSSYEMPLAPREGLGPWHVELRIHVRGDGRRGSVRALLPMRSEGQVVFDERAASGQLTFSIRDRDGERVGVWTGWLEDIQEIVYEFRAQSFAVHQPLPDPLPPPAPSVRQRWGQPSAAVPSSAPEVKDLIAALALPGPENPAARIRALYAFVTHEVASVPTAGDDALLTLSQREGSPRGKERLLVTLLRAIGVPARNVIGLELREGTAPQPVIWTEARAGGTWVPMSPTLDFFETRPASLVELGHGSDPLVEATGVRAVGHRYSSRRESLRPDEIANLMAPDNRVLAWLSLYRLPLATQSALRTLLLLPLGAFFVALFRNMVGVTTYGTFMPVLIALALRSFGLLEGIALVALVILFGVFGRLTLERLRLLMVPRLAILLSLVVLTVTLFALAARELGRSGLFAGVVLPMVILTMLIERISITIAEEGLTEALWRAASSLLVAGAVYPVFRSELAGHLVFSFPELVIAVMGLLVWMGGYTGYRLADLLRFRTLLEGGGPGAPRP